MTVSILLILPILRSLYFKIERQFFNSVWDYIVLVDDGRKQMLITFSSIVRRQKCIYQLLLLRPDRNDRKRAYSCNNGY